MIEQLVCFGLTRQEATLYNTLLSEGSATGYEAAKLTGISRSNTYNALAGLVEKGAAYIIEGTGTKYLPVSVEEFCNNKIRVLNQMKAELMRAAPQFREEAKGYITIKGNQHIIDKMKNMILEAEQRVYIAVSDTILHLIHDELDAAIKGKIKVVIITNEGYVNEQKGKEYDSVILYESSRRSGQIRLIVDSVKVLTGDLEENGVSTCLYSGNKNLVDVFKDMLKNEIILIEQKREGSKLK